MSMKPPVKPQSGYGPDRDKSDIHRRLKELEDRTADLPPFSGSVDSAIRTLSGSVDSAVRTLTSGGLTTVATDPTLTGDGTAGSPLSAAALSASIDAAWKSGDAQTWTSLQTGTTASLGAGYVSLQTGVTSSVGTLSGTIDARFANLSYSNIAVTGVLTVTGDLKVSGSITGSGDAWFPGNVNVGGTVSAAVLSANTFFSDTLKGDLLYVGFDAGISGSLTGSGDVLLRGDLTVAGSITGSGDASFPGNVNVGGTVSAAVLSSNNFFSDTLGADLLYVGDAGVSGSLTGSGDVLFRGDVTVQGTLSAGTVTQDNLSIAGSITGSGDARFDRNVLVLGVLEVGTLALANVNVDTVSTDMLFARNDAGITGSITGSGDVTFARHLAVGGTFTAGSIPALDTAYGNLQAGVTASLGSVYSTILVGTSASDAAVQGSLKAGATASLTAAYGSLQTGVTASVGAIYTTVLVGVSASDAAIQASLRTGVTASVNSIYTTILAGTSGSDAAVQTSLKAGSTASLNAAYGSLQTGVTSSINSMYTAIIAGTTASDAAVQTSLKSGLTASFLNWGSNLRVVGSITGSGDVRFQNIVGLRTTPTATLDVSGTIRAVAATEYIPTLVMGSPAHQWALYHTASSKLVLRDYTNVYGSNTGTDRVTFTTSGVTVAGDLEVQGTQFRTNGIILSGTINANNTPGAAEQVLKTTADGWPIWGPAFGSAELTGTVADLFVQGSITGSGGVVLRGHVLVGSASLTPVARVMVSSSDAFAVRIENNPSVSTAGSSIAGLSVVQGGTYSTTPGSRTSYGLTSVVTTTKTGANPLTNIAGYFSAASSSDSNYAILTGDGGVLVSEYLEVEGNYIYSANNLIVEGVISGSNYAVGDFSNGIYTPARLLLNRQVLTAATGTWTPTAGTKAVLLRAVGGGGAGGGAVGGSFTLDAGSGGGSGAYIEKWITGSAGSLITGGGYAVGGGGVGVSGGTGNDGLSSTIVIQGTLFTAKGGQGGGSMGAGTTARAGYPWGPISGSGANAAGSVPNVPMDVLSGEFSQACMRFTPSFGYAGSGGGGRMGIGGLGFTVGVQNGNPGSGYGAGGGGSGATTSSTIGGAGTSGSIIIDEYG